MGRAGHVVVGDAMRPAPESFSFPLRSGDARADALSNPFPLKLCESAQDAQHQPSCGAARVDALTQGREPHASVGERLNRVDEVREAPAEPIQLPAHDEIDLPAFGVGHQLVEGWSAVLRTADAGIDVFGGLPAASLAVTAKFQQLVLAGLVRGRDASVEAARMVVAM